MKEKWEKFFPPIDVEILTKNMSARIFTLKITGGNPHDFDEMRWSLHENGTGEIINISGIKRVSEDFTDNSLLHDSIYDLYWYDANGDDLLSIGDYLKVKVPTEYEYYLQGEVEFGETESGKMSYVPIFGEKLYLLEG